MLAYATKRIIRVVYFFERYVRTLTYSVLAYAYPPRALRWTGWIQTTAEDVLIEGWWYGTH